MKVRIIAPGLDSDSIRSHVAAQLRFFRQRGDDVRLCLPGEEEDLRPDLGLAIVGEKGDGPAAIAIYHLLGDYTELAAIRNEGDGIVLLHDHGQEPVNWQPAHYAELCLVNTSARRSELATGYNLPVERVRVLPQPGWEADYAAEFEHLVTEALADQGQRARDPESQERAMIPSGPAPQTVSLEIGLQLARAQADVMLRNYKVQSRLPLVGSTVAWLRRNLTSHLREPYVDPTLERQVAFNRTMVACLEQAQRRLAELEGQLRALRVQAGEPGPDEWTEDRG